MQKRTIDGKARDGRFVKIALDLEGTGWEDQCAVETVWAEEVSEGVFELSNCPFYFYGLSFGDKVAVVERDGRAFFDEVLERGGHSTYRVFLRGEYDADEFAQAWGPFDSLNCGYEGATDRLYAIDVPPASDVRSVYRALQEKVDAGYWDFEEAHFGHGDLSSGVPSSQE